MLVYQSGVNEILQPPQSTVAVQFAFSSEICREVDCRRVFSHDNMRMNPILGACMHARTWPCISLTRQAFNCTKASDVWSATLAVYLCTLGCDVGLINTSEMDNCCPAFDSYHHQRKQICTCPYLASVHDRILSYLADHLAPLCCSPSVVFPRASQLEPSLQTQRLLPTARGQRSAAQLTPVSPNRGRRRKQVFLMEQPH